MKNFTTKVLPLKPWKRPWIEQSILSKLNLEELEYLRERKIFDEADIILELLNRCKNK